MTLSPGQNVQPKRSMRTSPGGFSAFCSSILRERAPRPPRFIGQSAWMSRTGSNPKRFGMRACTHDLANHPLFCPARDDACRPLRADAGHLAQPAGLLLDDLKHGSAGRAYELLRIDWPDTADHPGAEMFLDALDRRRRRS